MHMQAVTPITGARDRVGEEHLRDMAGGEWPTTLVRNLVRGDWCSLRSASLYTNPARSYTK